MNSIINDIILESCLPNDCNKAAVKAGFKQYIQKKLDKTTPEDQPYVINVAGIPGSGKSTYINKLKQSHPNAVYIAFDEVMEKQQAYIDESNAVLAQQSGDLQETIRNLFKRWEIPARIAGYMLLNNCVDAKRSIIFEHSSTLIQHVELFNFILAQGYQVHFYHIDTDPDTAKLRVAQREIQQREKNEVFRVIPVEYITDRHQMLETLLPHYQKICTTFTIIKS